jgi:hypothetical protein
MSSPHDALPIDRHGICGFITDPEAEALAKFAADVPAGEVIVEIGGLYGASTAVIAKAAPDALVLCVDAFCWHPCGEASAARMREGLDAAGVRNVVIVRADSGEVGTSWGSHIACLFIDGSHEYLDTARDLANYGEWAQVIACHDYQNPLTPGVTRAVDEFCAVTPFTVCEQADFVCVLRRA